MKTKRKTYSFAICENVNDVAVAVAAHCRLYKFRYLKL